MAALTGMVSSQAVSSSSVTPQRTAESLFTDPTPMMLPVITCVVLTGIFISSVRKRVSEPAVCVQNPSNGVIFVILLPIVFMIFQPPDMVPTAMDVKQSTGTQSWMSCMSVSCIQCGSVDGSSRQEL